MSNVSSQLLSEYINCTYFLLHLHHFVVNPRLAGLLQEEREQVSLVRRKEAEIDVVLSPNRADPDYTPTSFTSLKGISRSVWRRTI